jgi:hypothetical protein
MAPIRYELVPRHGGWSIRCGGIVGPPYLSRETAVRDAVWIASLLQASGEDAEVYVDNQPVPLAPQESREQQS